MIYSENKKPFFVHFYIDDFDSPSVKTSTNIESIYDASSNGIPVIGILHNYFDENSVRVYTADEAANILQSEETFETPCIVDMTINGEAIPLLDVPSDDIFSFIEALYNWMSESDNFNILLKAKLYDNYPYDYYAFYYNKGIEQSDNIELQSQTYNLTIVGHGGSGSEITSYSTTQGCDINIMPLFCTSRAILDSGNYTYYAVFQGFSETNSTVIQMKNNLIRIVNNINEDMFNWENSNNDEVIK